MIKTNWLINLFHLLDASSSFSLRNLQNKVPSQLPQLSFLAIKCMLSKIDITCGLLFTLLIFFLGFSLLQHYNNKKTLQPIIHNTANYYTNNISEGMTTLYT